jgi:alkylated DNA nucleotide flippase Atl1
MNQNKPPYLTDLVFDVLKQIGKGTIVDIAGAAGLSTKQVRDAALTLKQLDKIYTMDWIRSPKIYTRLYTVGSKVDALHPKDAERIAKRIARDEERHRAMAHTKSSEPARCDIAASWMFNNV